MMDTPMSPERYATKMIVHHEMAVAMSKSLRASGAGTLADFADRVITTQTKEIAELRDWLKRNR